MFLLRLVSMLVFLLPASGVWAAPAMWLVSDEDSKIWLFGSVHLLPEGLDWRTPMLDEVLANADAVYFEADINSMLDGETAWMVLKAGVNTLGERLEDFLTPEQAGLVAAGAQKLNTPISYLRNFQPWMAALIIQSRGTSQAGFTDRGVDMTLMDDVGENRVRYLETVEFQLRIFSEMTVSDQVAMLMESIGSIGTESAVLGELIDSWAKGGDGPAKMVEQLSKEDAGYEERLFNSRNRNWVAELSLLMKDSDETALVVAGAGHMSGENGLPRLLEKAGYKVERVQ